MTVLLVVTPRSFRDGGTESKVDTLSRVSENNYVGGGVVAPALMRSRPCRPRTGTHSCY